MNLYLIKRTDHIGYDQYDSAVVAAPNGEYARNMSPSTGSLMTEEDWKEKYSYWASDVTSVEVTLIGTSVERGPMVVLASFNAG